MKIVYRIPSIIYNKYFLAVIIFLAWMLFFDRNDVFTQIHRRADLKEMENSKTYFAEKIAEGKKFSFEMRNNTSAIEKFVREKYLMKRDNEDLFLIQPAQQP